MANGWLTLVEDRPRATALISAAAIGDRVLATEWSGDFPDTGLLQLDGDLLGYVDVDEDEDTITLALPLAADHEVDSPVVLVASDGTPASDQYAHVTLTDGTEDLVVRIPASLDLRLPTGATPYEEAPWPVELTDDYAEIIAITQQLPAISRTPYMDAELYPDQTIGSGQVEVTNWTLSELVDLEQDDDGVFRIMTTGLYDLRCGVLFAPGNGARSVQFLFDGTIPSRVAVGIADSGALVTIELNVIRRCVAGTTVRVLVAQNSGSPLDIQGRQSKAFPATTLAILRVAP